MTKSEMINKISEEKKEEIRNADLNPAGYNTELYSDAYAEVFGGDVVDESSEAIFKKAVTDIWQRRA